MTVQCVHVIDVSTWGLYSMRVACFRLVHADCTCYSCWTVGTWVWYTKCMFACYRCEYIVLVLVVQLHVVGLAQSFLMVIVNMEYFIIIFIIRNSVFQIWIVSAELNSGCFFCGSCPSWWVWLENLSFSNGLLATSVCIFNLNSELETGTGNLDLQLETHICEFCRLLDIYIINYKAILI